MDFNPLISDRARRANSGRTQTLDVIQTWHPQFAADAHLVKVIYDHWYQFRIEEVRIRCEIADPLPLGADGLKSIPTILIELWLYTPA